MGRALMKRDGQREVTSDPMALDGRAKRRSFFHDDSAADIRTARDRFPCRNIPILKDVPLRAAIFGGPSRLCSFLVSQRNDLLFFLFRVLISEVVRSCVILHDILVV